MQPNTQPDNLTAEQLIDKFMADYTLAKRCSVQCPDDEASEPHTVWLKIDHQSFQLDGYHDVIDANWIRRQIAIALHRAIIRYAEPLEKQLAEYRSALSSHLCSAHQLPEPLTCDICNRVKWLENRVKKLGARNTELQQCVERAIKAASELQLQAARFEPKPQYKH